MAAARSLISEKQFLCCICLDVFTDPVTIPCGHNFCKSCITEHWRIRVHHKCPLCNEFFDRRPELRVNTLISEMASRFRQPSREKVGNFSAQECAKPGEVLCDVCAETKLRALKSCLVCLTSYCETHLKPHQMFVGLQRHELIDPVQNLESRMSVISARMPAAFVRSIHLRLTRTRKPWTCFNKLMKSAQVHHLF